MSPGRSSRSRASGSSSSRSSPKSGAGNRFDLEQAQADVAKYQSDLQAAQASVAQVRENLAAKTPAGVQQEVAQVLAQIAQAEAQLADAQWKLEEAVQYAPADGTIVALALRPGVMAVPFPAFPAMTFVEDEQWVVAFFAQNEVRNIEAGNEAEIALKTYPGRIIKCKVDSIIWATAQGQLPISGMLPNTGFGSAPDMRLAVKLRSRWQGRGPVPCARRARHRRRLHRAATRPSISCARSSYASAPSSTG